MTRLPKIILPTTSRRLREGRRSAETFASPTDTAAGTSAAVALAAVSASVLAFCAFVGVPVATTALSSISIPTADGAGDDDPSALRRAAIDADTDSAAPSPKSARRLSTLVAIGATVAADVLGLRAATDRRVAEERAAASATNEEAVTPVVAVALDEAVAAALEGERCCNCCCCCCCCSRSVAILLR